MKWDIAQVKQEIRGPAALVMAPFNDDLSLNPKALAANIRFIMDGETGTMIHSTVPPHQINRATVHATVSEFWYVLEGHGEIWRDNGLESCVTTLVAGTSIDIPVGTAFLYRNARDVDLKFI